MNPIDSQNNERRKPADWLYKTERGQRATTYDDLGDAFIQNWQMVCGTQDQKSQPGKGFKWSPHQEEAWGKISDLADALLAPLDTIEVFSINPFGTKRHDTEQRSAQEDDPVKSEKPISAEKATILPCPLYPSGLEKQFRDSLHSDIDVADYPHILVARTGSQLSDRLAGLKFLIQSAGKRWEFESLILESVKHCASLARLLIDVKSKSDLIDKEVAAEEANEATVTEAEETTSQVQPSIGPHDDDEQDSGDAMDLDDEKPITSEAWQIESLLGRRYEGHKKDRKTFYEVKWVGSNKSNWEEDSLIETYSNGQSLMSELNTSLDKAEQAIMTAPSRITRSRHPTPNSGVSGITQ
jgi:hypothetical protein